MYGGREGGTRTSEQDKWVLGAGDVPLRTLLRVRLLGAGGGSNHVCGCGPQCRIRGRRARQRRAAVGVCWGLIGGRRPGLSSRVGRPR